MKKIKFALLLNLILLIYSCKKGNEKFEGIWIFDSEVNVLNENESSASRMVNPIIFDFKENNELTVKIFGIKNNTLQRTWELKSDSIIKLDNQEYSIKTIEKEEITLIDYNRADTFILTLRKPKKTEIKLNVNQIESILKSNIWKSKDLSMNQEYNSFEFFENNTMIYRYKMQKNDSTEYLQNENWNLTEYKNYFFLYNYSDLFYGKGNWNKISQILEVSDNFIKFEKDLDNKIYQNEFYSETPKSENIEKNIIGKWKSENSLENDYGKYISQNQIENGIIKLCNENLFLNITKDSIEFKTDTFTLEKYKWNIGKDNKTLILEKEHNFDMRKGSFVKVANFLEVEEKEFRLHFFENSFFTGMDKPSQLIINKVQNFKKVEKEN